MLYEEHEVLGSNYPIFKTINDSQYTLDDILNTKQPLEQFKRVGFLEVTKYRRTLYKPVYERGVS